MEDTMPTFPPRRAEPGSRHSRSIEGGRHIELVADDAGVVVIATPEQAALADVLDLPTVGRAPRRGAPADPGPISETPAGPAEEA